MKSECRVSWIAKMMMVIICSREGGCVYELTSLYDPTLFLRGTNSFLQHF